MPYCEARDKKRSDRMFSIITLANYHIITFFFSFHVQHTSLPGFPGGLFTTSCFRYQFNL
jgi:hypothetical protein